MIIMKREIPNGKSVRFVYPATTLNMKSKKLAIAIKKNAKFRSSTLVISSADVRFFVPKFLSLLKNICVLV